MNSSADRNLTTLLADAKCNIKEANRLFMTEMNAFLSSNSTRSSAETLNMECMNSRLHRTESKLQEIRCKFISWEIQRDAVELSSTRNIDLKCIYLEERCRTAALYTSLEATVSLKQSQESQLYDLNQKYLILQAEHQQVLNQKTETDKLYTVLNATYEGEIKQMKEIVRAQDRSNGESQSSKRRKLNVSKSTNNTTLSAVDRSNTKIRDRKSIKKIPCRLSVTPQISSISRIRSDSVNSMASRIIKEEPGSKAKSSENKELLLGRKIQREFPGHGVFIGIIKSYKVPYYTICYDDGDTEEMNMTEMKRWLID